MTANPMPEDDQWALEVGRFVLAFGRIEWLTYWALDSLTQKDLHDYLRGRQVQERVKLLLMLTKDRSGLEWKTLHTVLGEVRDMLEHRHLIAHNDLWIDVLEQGDEVFFNGRRIVSGRNLNNSIDFDGLKQKRHDAQMLAARFQDAIHDALETLSSDPLTVVSL